MLFIKISEAKLPMVAEEGTRTDADRLARPDQLNVATRRQPRMVCLHSYLLLPAAGNSPLSPGSSFRTALPNTSRRNSSHLAMRPSHIAFAITQADASRPTPGAVFAAVKAVSDVQYAKL